VALLGLPGCAWLESIGDFITHNPLLQPPPTLDEQIAKEAPKALRKQPIAGLTNPRFRTDEAMIAASELLLSADPFWARFEELGWLDEGFDYRDRLIETGPAYSRYNVENLVLFAGMGVSLEESPHFDPAFDRRLLERAGIDDVPIPSTQPLYLEYASGDPHYVQYPDFGDPDRGTPPNAATLRWNPSWFDRTIEPATYGSALRAQVLWAKRLLWELPPMPMPELAEVAATTDDEDRLDDPTSEFEVADSEAIEADEADGETGEAEAEAAEAGEAAESDEPEEDLGEEAGSDETETDERQETEEPEKFDDPFGDLFETEPIEEDITGEDRYHGLKLLEMAANKIIAIHTELAWSVDEERLGGLPSPYRPGGDAQEPLVYFPHKIIEREHFEPKDPDNFDPLTIPPGRFVLIDERSYLYDQAILLEAMLEFVEIADPKRFPSSIALFPNGVTTVERPIFADTVPAMARQIAEAIVRNIVEMHWDRHSKSLVSYATATRRGRNIRPVDAGLALIALERYRSEPWANPALVEAADAIISAQGAFLVKYQYKDGAFADNISAATGDSKKPSGFHLTSQMYAIRALLASYSVTGDFRMRQAAWRTYQMVEKVLWSPAYDLYRVEDVVARGRKYNVVTPLVLGSTVGALRELALATRDFDVVERMVRFLRGIERSGLLLSETWKTGENPSDDWDSDDDRILKPRFAGGTYGLAPVYASEILVYIPSTGEIIPPRN
jgi:hypothetical protein